MTAELFFDELLILTNLFSESDLKSKKEKYILNNIQIQITQYINKLDLLYFLNNN